MRAFWKGAKRKRGRRRPLTMGIGHVKEKIYRCKRFRMQIKQFSKLEITLYLFHPNEDQLLYLVHFMSQMDRFEDSSEIRRSHKEAKLLNKLSPASKWEKKTDVGFPATKNWVVVSNIFYFHPYLGKISILTNIFQRGWNHQPENLGLLGFLRCFVGEGLVIEHLWKCPSQGDCSGASPKRGIVGGESPRKRDTVIHWVHLPTLLHSAQRIYAFSYEGANTKLHELHWHPGWGVYPSDTFFRFVPWTLLPLLLLLPLIFVQMFDVIPYCYPLLLLLPLTVTVTVMFFLDVWCWKSKSKSVSRNWTPKT